MIARTHCPWDKGVGKQTPVHRTGRTQVYRPDSYRWTESRTELPEAVPWGEPSYSFLVSPQLRLVYISTASLINHKLRSSPVTAALAYTLLLFMQCSQMNVDFITSEETTSGGSVTARIIYITLIYLLFHLFIFYPLCVLFTWILMLSCVLSPAGIMRMPTFKL